MPSQRSPLGSRRLRVFLAPLFIIAVVAPVFATATSAGAASGTASVMPSTLSFSSQGLGITSAPQTVTVTDTGSSDLTMWGTCGDGCGGNPNITGADAGDFSTQNNGCDDGTVLEPTQYCTFQVTFEPTSTDPEDATVQVFDSASNSPQSVTLTGQGVTATADVSTASLNFPSQGLGITSSAKTVTVTNTGSTIPLVMWGYCGEDCGGNPSLTGANSGDFGIQNNGCDDGTVLDPGQFCTFQVTFTPSSTDPEDATVQIFDNASVNQPPESITLTGQGVTATADVSTASLNFPSQGLGITSSAKTVTVTNTGSTIPLVMWGYCGEDCGGNPSLTGANSGDFGIQNNGCDDGTVLDPGQFCTFQVTFTPSSTDPEDATVQIFDNASVNQPPESITLTGQGVVPPTTVNPVKLAFSSNTVGVESAPQTVTVTNTGAATPLVMWGYCGQGCGGNPAIIGADSGDFAIEHNGCDDGTVLDPGQFCTFQVTFTPSSKSPEDATVQIFDNASVNQPPEVVSLTGNAKGLPPSVTALSSRSGPTSGGTFASSAGTITITGSGFTRSSTVKFGSISATKVTVDSSTEITVVPPASSSNTGVFVTVATAAGSSPTSCSTSVAKTPIIQSKCNDSYFYMKSSSDTKTISANFLSGKSFSITPTSGPDGAPSGIVHECGYKTPPKAGATPSGTVDITVPDKDTTFTPNLLVRYSQDANIPSAFMTSGSVTLNHPIGIKFSLSIAYGDCIDIPIISFAGVAGVYVMFEPNITGKVSYALTLEPGTYSISGGGWVGGTVETPSLSLACPLAKKCIVGSGKPSWSISASVVDGIMVRLGPSLGVVDAYVEAGPAAGLAVGTGSGGSFAEACAGGTWDAHFDVTVLGHGIQIGASGTIGNPVQIAGTGLTDCPL